jgi:uncharacterized membrane protein
MSTNRRPWRNPNNNEFFFFQRTKYEIHFKSSSMAFGVELKMSYKIMCTHTFQLDLYTRIKVVLLQPDIMEIQTINYCLFYLLIIKRTKKKNSWRKFFRLRVHKIIILRWSNGFLSTNYFHGKIIIIYFIKNTHTYVSRAEYKFVWHNEVLSIFFCSSLLCA